MSKRQNQVLKAMKAFIGHPTRENMLLLNSACMAVRCESCPLSCFVDPDVSPPVGQFKIYCSARDLSVKDALYHFTDKNDDIARAYLVCVEMLAAMEEKK